MSRHEAGGDAFVPVIDFSPSASAVEADRRALAETVDEICRTSGFLVIVEHGVDARLIEEVQHRTLEFFALPEAVKRQVETSGSDPGGYRPLRSSYLGQSVAEDTPPDLCEFFGLPSAPAHARDHRWHRWPDVAGFATAWLAYYGELEALAARIMRIFALGLDLPEEWFDPRIDAHITALYANHYPGLTDAPPEGQLRLGPHTDFGSLTLLLQDDSPGGLQVQRSDGSWQSVAHVPGSYVVNIGDLMARWTNDRWVSTMHRVVVPDGRDAERPRLTMPFFHQPNEEAVIDCIPTCVGPDRPCRYEAVTSGAWRDVKVNKTRD